MSALRHRLLAAASVAALLLVALAPTDAAQPPPCDAFQIEYTLAANLKLTDTPFGKGDGIYPVGPGKTVLRFDNVRGVPGGTVNMLSYGMHEHFVIRSSVLFWSSEFTSTTDTSTTPDACAVAARGRLTGRTLVWQTPVLGYRTDGVAVCKGSLCGKGGAPPPGRTQLHLGPDPVWFKAFDFAPDMQTFTMQDTQVEKSESPKLTASVAVSGREVRRSCVAVKPCR